MNYKSLFIAFVVPLLTTAVNGINLRPLNAERGFTKIYALQLEEREYTVFGIVLNPKTFISQLPHLPNALPNSKTKVYVSLEAVNSDTFRGLTVELGRPSNEEEEYILNFRVPSADLQQYNLVFRCVQFPGDESPGVGGISHIATLTSIRDSPDTITEESEVWKKRMLSENEFLRRGEAGNFGGSIKKIEPRR